MPYMKRDHGSEHDRGGCLGGENQPNEPAPQRLSIYTKSPPDPLYGPRFGRPRNKAFVVA